MHDIALWLALASLAAWLYLLAGRGGFWRCTEILADVDREPSRWPDVVAVIPARNEAELIGACLASLARQDYPAGFSVVLVDDNSYDETFSAARGAWPGSGLDIVSGAALA